MYAHEFGAAQAKIYTQPSSDPVPSDVLEDVGLPEGGSADKTRRLATPAVCFSLE